MTDDEAIEEYNLAWYSKMNEKEAIQKEEDEEQNMFNIKNQHKFSILDEEPEIGEIGHDHIYGHEMDMQDSEMRFQ